MKKLLIALMLVTAVATQAQWIYQSFDNAVGPFFTDPAVLNTNFFASGPAPKMDLFNDPDHVEGTGSMRIEYKCQGSESWGGYTVRTVPTLENYVDFSTGTHLSLWYKVVVPAAQTVAGAIKMELKVGDFDDEGNRELWVQELKLDMADASGQWKNILVPLAIGASADVGFTLQSGSNDGELKLDKIKSYELTTVWVGAGDATNPPELTGTILFDKWEIVGSAYPSLLTFDNSASKWGLDDMGWAGADGKGAVLVTDEANDKIEGAGSLKFDYTCNASQDWGGFVAFDQTITAPEKFIERTSLVLWLKNLKAITSVKPERAMLRFFIMENSNGTDTEEWIIKVPIDLSKVSDWTRYVLPLKTKTLPNGDQDPPTDGFAPKSNNGDKTFNHDKITKIRLEILAAGAGPLAGPKGEKLTGTLLFDICQTSGFQAFDITKPSAPKNLAAIKGNYSNLVSWGDVDNEGTEKYDVYASKSAITSLTAKGVEKVGIGIARAVQVFEHTLKAPKTDKDVTWYYAVQAIDKNKNEGDIATTGPVTNKAKGIPTVAIKTVNFKADGNLNEFAGITPFQLKTSNGTGFLVTGDKCDGDADASIEAFYVAIDKDYLYVGADVNDDVVFDDNKYYPTDTWQADALELFIGLYDIAENPLTVAYKRGKTPDYHLRFNKQKLREDHWDVETDELLLPGANYYWAEKFPSGYVVEAKIPLTDLANRRDAGAVKLDEIYVKEGYKVMFDIGQFDNDGNAVNREGRIFWTATNGDHGYENATLCGYTWIGDTDVIATDVEKEEMPVTYSLDQNYPNPFNPTTQIKYSILNAGNVSLKVFDVLGREVADLVNQNQDAGHYTVNFNASSLSSGIYFYRIESGSFVSVKKMMLVK
ncbi:MAG: sugar-binding protein [Melioribacteraceae bacterium]